MRRFYGLLLAAVCALTLAFCVSGCEQAEKSTDESYFSFIALDNGTYAIKANTGAELPECVIIPATFEGAAVTEIAENGFTADNCIGIKYAVIKPLSVKIGENAFKGLPNLRQITVKSLDVEVGDFAFYGCEDLTDVRFLNAATGYIGSFAFSGTAIKFISVPDGMTAIGDEAFYGCSELTSAVIPATVKQIGVRAFTACTALKNIEVDSLNVLFKSENGNLFDYTGRLVQYATGKSAASIEVSYSVGQYAFAYCSALTDVKLVSGATQVECFAFIGCKNVTLTVDATCSTSAFQKDWDFIG